MSADRDSKAAQIRQLLATEGDSVQQNTGVFNQGRYDSTARLDDYERIKEEARAIKEDAIENLDDLIEELTESVEENGGTVYIAEDAADANEYIANLADERDADRVVKSKSMTSEEIEVNEALEAHGVHVDETDLAEFVLQIADEAPSHIVAPAIHKSREEIAQLFNEYFEPKEPLETAEELTQFAREVLGERIEDADIGMTGANFLVAESGSMALVTSEGNARKCVTAPDVHVAVAGVEKVLPTVRDLQPFVELIGRSGTGQDITSYVSLLTPPVASPTVDFDSEEPGFGGENGDREFHLVLLDNGRFEMREDEQLKETLYCIRCAACSNVCANFQHVGGHAFGGETYSGGIATGWETGVHGIESAGEFNDLCTGCSRCVPACPVKIDIPWINTVVRDRLNRGADADTFDHLVDGLSPDEENPGLDPAKRLFGNAELLFKLGSATAPVSNWLAAVEPIRDVLDEVAGIDRRRDLPTFRRETLVDWFEGRGCRIDPEDARREAVLYPDLYTNYSYVDRGRAAIRTLEALGVHVTLSDPIESGRAPLSQGMIRTASEQASEVYGSLAEHVDAGRDVVVIEPSDLAMFREDYRRLLPERSAERLSEGSYEIMEYVYGLLENGANTGGLAAGTKALDYHSHCQQRTLGLEEYTIAVLERLGHEVHTTQAECCGMAGSFGYKSQYYDLSVAAGETLLDEFEDEHRPLLTSGTSCTDQLDDLGNREPHHPIETIAPPW